MKHNFFETLLGAIVLCISFMFLYMAYTAGATQTNGGYHVKASFDRIDGLSVGNDVKISGVKVGAVTKVEVDHKNYRALVTFTVKKDIELPLDSSAEIVSDGLLGGKYINLAIGSESERLRENDVMEFTQSAVNLEQLMSKYMFSPKDDGKKDEVQKDDTKEDKKPEEASLAA